MSLVDQQVELRNLTPLLRSGNTKGFMQGTILFQWPWRCMTHSSMIWIISLGSVAIFSMIDDWEIICPCLFTFNFLGNVKSHDIPIFNIRRAVDEIASYHERDQLPPFFWFLGHVHILAFLWPSLFVSLVMVLAMDLFDFCETFVSTNILVVLACHLKLITLIEANKLFQFIIKVLSQCL